MRRRFIIDFTQSAIKPRADFADKRRAKSNANPGAVAICYAAGNGTKRKRAARLHIVRQRHFI
jgi:hypothetical protein